MTDGTPTTTRIASVVGTDAYRRYILRLNAALIAAGHTLRPDDISATIELALNLAGVRHGLKAPRRTPLGFGGARQGSGQRKKGES
jgi:hypothetical protein